jgi:hypothetical protein
MPDQNPIAGLYPSPPQPGQNALSNPWQAIAGIATLQANQRAQQQFQGQIAAGNALMRGLNPDGSFDPAAALGAAQSGPALGPAGSQFTGDILARRGQDIDNATRKLNLGVSNNAALASILAPYANQDTLSNEDQYNIKAKLAAAGVDPATVAAADITTPFKTMKAARTGAIQTMGAGAAATPVTGTPSPITNAPTVQPLATTVGAGTRPVGLPPGTGESSAALKVASGQQYASDLLASNNYKRSIYPLQQAIPALEALGKTGTGPGTEQINSIKSFFQSMGLPGFDADKITNFNLAQKYLTDYVNQTGNTGTNDKLAAAFAGNPSTKIANAAALDVAKSAYALRAMDEAKVRTFQTTGLPDEQYSRWVNNVWNKTVDPRAFGIPYMSPQVKDILDKQLTKEGPQARANFMSSLGIAHNVGMTDVPTSPSPEGPVQ